MTAPPAHPPGPRAHIRRTALETALAELRPFADPRRHAGQPVQMQVKNDTLILSMTHDGVQGYARRVRVTDAVDGVVLASRSDLERVLARHPHARTVTLGTRRREPDPDAEPEDARDDTESLAGDHRTLFATAGFDDAEPETLYTHAAPTLDLPPPGPHASTVHVDPRTFERAVTRTAWARADEAAESTWLTQLRLRTDGRNLRLEATNGSTYAWTECHVQKATLSEESALVHVRASALDVLARACRATRATRLTLRFDDEGFEAHADELGWRTASNPTGKLYNTDFLRAALAPLMSAPEPVPAARVDAKPMRAALAAWTRQTRAAKPETARPNTVALLFTPGALALEDCRATMPPVPVPARDQPLTTRHQVDTRALKAWLATAQHRTVRFFHWRQTEDDERTMLVARAEGVPRSLAILSGDAQPRKKAQTAPTGPDPSEEEQTQCEAQVA